MRFARHFDDDLQKQEALVAGARNIYALLSQARDIVQSHEYHVKR